MIKENVGNDLRRFGKNKGTCCEVIHKVNNRQKNEGGKTNFYCF